MMRYKLYYLCQFLREGINNKESNNKILFYIDYLSSKGMRRPSVPLVGPVRFSVICLIQDTQISLPLRIWAKWFDRTILVFHYMTSDDMFVILEVSDLH